MALSLITDRTAGEVARLQVLRSKINETGWTSLTNTEKAEWVTGRGAYNTTDLNRVGAAVSYLAELMRSYGYEVTVNPVTTWKPGDETTATDEFTQADAANYLTNLNTLNGVFASTTELPASLDRLTCEVANNIERLLLHLLKPRLSFCSSYYHCLVHTHGIGQHCGDAAALGAPVPDFLLKALQKTKDAAHQAGDKL